MIEDYASRMEKSASHIRTLVKNVWALQGYPALELWPGDPDAADDAS
jgi:hypothetical protein